MSIPESEVLGGTISDVDIMSQATQNIAEKVIASCAKL